MKAIQILYYFVETVFDGETTNLINLNEYNDLRIMIGAVDGQSVPRGTYLVYYEETKMVIPDFILHDDEDNEIYLLKVEE